MIYTILIVEDEYLVRQGLTKLVNVAAYDMEIIGQAENGRQAWDLIQKQVPDIILTDINMPQLNGIQLASLVRETYHQVHLVFLTATMILIMPCLLSNSVWMTTCSSPFPVRILRKCWGKSSKS